MALGMMETQDRTGNVLFIDFFYLVCQKGSFWFFVVDLLFLLFYFYLSTWLFWALIAAGGI